MKQIIFKLQCLCTIWLNRAIIIDNYSDTSRSVWHYKRDKVPNNSADLTTDNSQPFKYKTLLMEK